MPTLLHFSVSQSLLNWSDQVHALQPPPSLCPKSVANGTPLEGGAKDAGSLAFELPPLENITREPRSNVPIRSERPVMQHPLRSSCN